MIRGSLLALGALLLSSCYDSRWGQEKQVQKMTAAKMAAPDLRADGDAPQRRARVMRLRAHVTSAYGAQVVDPKREVQDIVDEANGVVEPLLGVHIAVQDVKSWELASDDDLDTCLKQLASEDKGDDVEWVAGFVGAFPKATYRFHDVGRANVVGKHMVLRAASRADETDAIEKSFGELSEDERHRLRKGLKRHRAGAVFLHELGHSLGSVHTAEHGSFMYPAYDPRVKSFGEPVSDLLRASIESRDDARAQTKALLEAYARTPKGVFIESERAELVASAERAPNASPPPPPPPAPAQPSVPETPTLAPADRAAYVKAYEAQRAHDFMTAWETAKPLFARYPDVFEVQDLRCSVATNVLPFEWARKECDALMSITTAPGRGRGGSR